MDAETALHAFATAGNDLPRGAMRWALEHWDEAAPVLLPVLERFADGTDRSGDAPDAVFFILHLAGERRETRAFGPLCRLARDGDAIERVLGDGVTTTLKRIMTGTYDGDLDALKSVVEAPEADEFVRAGALEALAYLAATGRIARDQAEAYLRRLYDTLQPQRTNFVWVGWVTAVAGLGLEGMSDIVRQAFERRLIDPMAMGYEHFREDLERGRDDPGRVAGFGGDELAPLDDVIGELSGWYGFSEAFKRDQERRAAGLAAEPALSDPPRPAINPFKGIGRNDPCPCGSGKKFKRCCLA